MVTSAANVRIAIVGLIGLVIFAFFFSALFPGAVTTLVSIDTTNWTVTMVLLLEFIIIVIFLAVVILVLQLIGLKLF